MSLMTVEPGYEMQTTLLRLPKGRDSMTVRDYVKELPDGVRLVAINKREPQQDWTISIGNEIVLSFSNRDLLDLVRARQLI